MYQFTTTNVINSAYALDYNGNILVDGAGSQIAKYVGTAAGLDVRKIGNFKTANIVSIYKRPYTAGVLEVAEVTIPTIASGLVARLEVVIKLSGSTQSEYTNYTLDFQKPIVVEVISSGTASTDATALVAQLNGLKNRFGHSYFTATVDSSTKVRITCKEYEQRVKSMIISKEVASPNSIVQPEYENVSSTTFTVVTAGKVGFGDTPWMMRQVMLPTAENVRYFGISKDERPIIGGNYSEYTLRYSVTKDGTDGILGAGTSVTTHVFFVLESLVPYWEAAIYTTTKPIISIQTDQAFTLTATDDTTAAVFIDISDLVPFISAASEITATSSAVGKATIGAITVATPTGTPPVQTARIVLTKVATGATTISVTIDGVTKTKAVTIG
jgi:hypothetical protein